ncbi:PIN domain-containing protein [Streptomyces thermolilacinus]|uniref:PIN domain-containing protein n=1 Tax=Streptomyces thermolilacinus TaxID=285540 RepID=UPI0033C89134
MRRYLVDSTALRRLPRDPALAEAWAHETDEGSLGSCHPQRTEFRRSARNLDQYDAMTDTFGHLYPDVPVPKGAWPWVEAAQYRLARRGRDQSLSMVDRLVCATAAHHGLVVLHDDKDFAAAAGTDLAERSLYDVPV